VIVALLVHADAGDGDATSVVTTIANTEQPRQHGSP